MRGDAALNVRTLWNWFYTSCHMLSFCLLPTSTSSSHPFPFNIFSLFCNIYVLFSVLPFSFHLFFLLMSLSHLLHVCFLTTCPFISLCPTLPPSVLPLCGDMNWCVSWVDHSLQLLSANCNSLSLMCLCLSVSPPLSLSLSLSPPLSFPPSFTLSCLLPSLSLSFLLSVSAPTISFISLWDRAVRKIQPLVHKQSNVVLSACACVHVPHAV